MEVLAGECLQDGWRECEVRKRQTSVGTGEEHVGCASVREGRGRFGQQWEGGLRAPDGVGGGKGVEATVPEREEEGFGVDMAGRGKRLRPES